MWYLYLLSRQGSTPLCFCYDSTLCLGYIFPVFHRGQTPTAQPGGIYLLPLCVKDCLSLGSKEKKRVHDVQYTRPLKDSVKMYFDHLFSIDSKY